MRDKEFLIWLHERLEHKHGENPCLDYMHKLRTIINGYDVEKVTPNIGTGNSLEESLGRKL